jgi:hypothetical protein
MNRRLILNTILSIFIIIQYLCSSTYCDSSTNFLKNKPFTTTSHNFISSFIQQSSSSSNKITYYDIISSPCSTQNCKSPYGSCKDSNTCLCNSGQLYVPLFLSSSNASQYCFYSQKSQGIAFLLELMFVVGIGHFYSGRMLLGILKLMFVLLIICYDCGFKIIWRSKNLKTFKNLQSLSYVLYFTLLLWQMTDLCLYGLNKYTDGNGIPLHSYSS